MLKSFLASFVLVAGFANSALSQQARPLPNPIINIQCGQLSILRHTRLANNIGNQQVPVSCAYRIQALSFNVCQLRLEFRAFSMTGPTLEPSNLNGAYQMCNGDSMQVGNVTLCGENTGQHIYIPLNPRNQNERITTITFNTRSGNSRPVWDIAVHQLECLHGQGRSLDAIEPATTADKSETFRQPRTFFTEWIAPSGCLQYFIEPSGQIESFNFNNGVGPYMGDMNYAICFRRLRGNRDLRLTTTFFRMNNGNPNNPGFNEDCLSAANTPQRSEDFLFIPNAETDTTPTESSTRARLFCGRSLNSRIVTSSPPGPFVITFNSDRNYLASEEIGFRMQYDIV